MTAKQHQLHIQNIKIPACFRWIFLLPLLPEWSVKLDKYAIFSQCIIQLLKEIHKNHYLQTLHFCKAHKKVRHQEHLQVIKVIFGAFFRKTKKYHILCLVSMSLQWQSAAYTSVLLFAITLSFLNLLHPSSQVFTKCLTYIHMKMWKPLPFYENANFINSLYISFNLLFLPLPGLLSDIP